ncbi:MAG: hypothetical protein MJ245_06925 [Clostridia bacterium]|nr:hypothetical protein [Clostridia bacterium]
MSLFIFEYTGFTYSIKLNEYGDIVLLTKRLNGAINEQKYEPGDPCYESNLGSALIALSEISLEGSDKDYNMFVDFVTSLSLKETIHCGEYINLEL